MGLGGNPIGYHPNGGSEGPYPTYEDQGLSSSSSSSVVKRSYDDACRNPVVFFGIINLFLI